MFKFSKMCRESTEFYKEFYAPHEVLGYIEETDPRGRVCYGTTVLKLKPGAAVPTFCAFDYGDHYILDRGGHYDRVDKATGAVTEYVENC